MKNLIRYDRGIIQLSGRKPVRTDDGTLLLDAVFARDGVLDYKILNPASGNGLRRELRLPEENKKAIAQFGIIPVTDEHPPGLLDSNNASLYRKGLTLQSPRYESIPGKGGFVLGQIAVFDSDLQERILSGEQVETSSGYKCSCEEKSGEYKHADGSFYNYDAIQRNLEINHQAITRKGRAGSDVCVYLDSLRPSDEVGISIDAIHYDVFDAALKPHYIDLKGSSRMATIKMDDATYEVTEPVAAAFSAYRYRHDALERQYNELQENYSTVLGERDLFEYQLQSAEETLDSVGFVRDGENGYRLDMDKAKKKMAEYESDDEDEEDDDEEDDMPPPKKGKGKKSCNDSRQDSLEFLSVLQHADSLFGQLTEEGETFSNLYGQHLDSASDARRIVLQALNPQVNLDEYGDDEVDAMYDLEMSRIEDEDEEDYEEDDEEDEITQDSAEPRADYSGELSQLIAQAKMVGRTPSEGTGVDEAWKQPLTLSR